MWIGQDVGNSGAAYFMYLCLGSGKFYVYNLDDFKENIYFGTWYIVPRIL